MYAKFRDLMGALWPSVRDYGLSECRISFLGCGEQDIKGALVGLELASYRFLAQRKPASDRRVPKITLIGVTSQQVKTAYSLASGMNLARHLVNTDATTLNPASFTKFLETSFAKKSGVTVKVYDEKALKQLNMNLLVAVGAGAQAPASLVKISYRPAKNKSKAIAIIGKGVTFDTGGLDIKPASGMRLMKKDMGGAASVVGLAHWVTEVNLGVPIDFYLPLAENAIGSKAFKPGDVIRARNGALVEIHNTDAEGRLVLADAIDLAKSETDPALIIDLATLTGAMRVALGAQIAGMFATHDRLAQQAVMAGLETGDICWRMPLFEDYRGMLKSSFADIANASDSGFAGAITAALFLQRFVGETPWLHFDLYCWNDSARGGCVEPGGSGQGIQMLARFLEDLSVGGI
jgi:leucyl aminopeptidase